MHDGRVGARLNDSIEVSSGGIHNELPSASDLELGGSGWATEKRKAGGVDDLCLEVLVEVGIFL